MKVFGKKNEFSLIRIEGTRTTVCYGKQDVDKVNATWEEVYLYHKQHGSIGFNDVKESIIGDINRRTDEKIVSGFVWTPEGEEDPIPVWLSVENQFNFKSAYDLAVQKQGATLPVTFKMGEDEEGNPIYHTFATMEDADDFYVKAVAFVNQCLTDGWAEKDGIDWSE